jgi:hypothetical protein
MFLSKRFKKKGDVDPLLFIWKRFIYISWKPRQSHMLKAHAIKILDFYILKLKRSHCARTDYILCKASKLQHIL